MIDHTFAFFYKFLISNMRTFPPDTSTRTLYSRDVATLTVRLLVTVTVAEIWLMTARIVRDSEQLRAERDQQHSWNVWIPSDKSDGFGQWSSENLMFFRTMIDHTLWSWGPRSRSPDHEPWSIMYERSRQQSRWNLMISMIDHREMWSLHFIEK